MAKKQLRDLSRDPVTDDEFNALMDALVENQHAIATAILGYAMVEYDLERLLRSKFKHQDDKTWGRLTAENGPLNSFYSKIELGYAFGIYNDGMRNDLNIVRNVRNAFAHSMKMIKFDHPLVVKELRKATRSSLLKRHWKRATAQELYALLCFRVANKLAKLLVRKARAGAYRAHRQFLASLLRPPRFGLRDILEIKD